MFWAMAVPAMAMTIIRMITFCTVFPLKKRYSRMGTKFPTR